MVVFEDVTKEQISKLGSCIPVKTMHETYRCEFKGVSLVLYTSGKLLLQGKKEAVGEVAKVLQKQGVGTKTTSPRFRKEEGWIIGSDESLKGDTFGGLVVAAVKADENMRKELIALGVNDSKKLSDTEIFPLAASIKRKFPCVIENFFPDEYNKYSGVTEILNRLHKKAGDYLKPGTHVVDKYPGCTAGNIREEKAESKFVEVAAASILARAAALQQLNDLSRSAGFPLPKGSTHVQAALEKLKESGLDPGKFVKLHFRNVQLILAKP